MSKKGFLYQSAVVASLAGFLFGFDTVIISGAEQKIQALWSVDSTLNGLAISMAMWGPVTGSLIGGWPALFLGRKKTLIRVRFFVPETKGIQLEKMERRLHE